jgi:hypothetical protein
VHDRLEEHGWEVLIADATKVKGLAPLTCKTDKIDAGVLARLSARDLVPEIWLPDPSIRRERELARFRLHLVRHRTTLKNRIHAARVAFGHPCPVSDLFGHAGRELLDRIELPDPCPEDFINEDGRRKAEGLLRLYGATGSGAQVQGAFAAPPGGRIGDDAPIAQMTDLRRAAVVGLLEGNPTPPALAKSDDDIDPNGGWKSATSDNAALWGHGIDESGYTAVEYGAMVTTLSGGHNVLREDSVSIRPPAELPNPFMYGFFDGPYADAAYAVISAGDDRGRRVGRAIDWLDLAWRNSPSLTPEVRAVGLRTGFEVLFGSDDTYKVRDLLSDLVDGDDVVRVSRTWASRTGKPRTAELSDLSWWFMQFAFLRNAITHGDEVPEGQLEYEGRPHIWLGEARLRHAIKLLVAQAGYPLVLLGRQERNRQERIETAMRLLAETDEGEEDAAQPKV